MTNYAATIAMSVITAFLLVFSDGAAAVPQGVLQGIKLSEDGSPFTSPGATVSIRKIADPPGTIRVTGYGPSFDYTRSRFSASLERGWYEIGIQVPDGYEAQYSVCSDCMYHAVDNFRPYGEYNSEPLLVYIRESSYVDVHVVFRRLASSLQDVGKATQELHCNIPGFPNPTAPTDTLLFKASDAWARVGIDRAIGGVGVLLELINPIAPNSPLQIIEARSSGGAAWQSGFGVADQITNRILHFNQAAGNSAEVWGYEGSYAIGADIGFVQTNWTPLFSNDYRTAINFTAPSVLTSPCYHTGYRLGDGRMKLVPQLIPVPGGNILRLQNSYSLRVAQDQDWKWIQEDQAMYLDRASARKADLRVYLSDPASDSRLIGPIRAFDSFATFSRDRVRNVICTANDCMIASRPISYALLVWRVQGRDIAIAVHQNQLGKKFFVFIRLRPNMTCRGSDVCGNVQFHALLADSAIDSNGPHRFKAGSINACELQYDIGTPKQLGELGFSVPVSDNASSAE